ncbi:MAG: DEAD/DEAH box helicase family protein [Planctomycetes bacterium]|nr:DEAD/DEAH box helicase family protein [Planctomycetota bacterium]
MNPLANAIANRLSLRPPQRDSLELLASIFERIDLRKDTDLAAALAAIQAAAPSVQEFERDFPSLCFALATGVGKTRLMGAFIAWLAQARHIRHFFVLAPNLTIYEKLIRDFTPNTPKYVFTGISEFAINPPEIITGDNYESGRGVRRGYLPGMQGDVHVNIFNISKITSPEGRESASTRKFRTLHEVIGESYFDYLSHLDDLVLLMDESHRYRASAGMRAINELKPILGLELTATPQVERGGDSVPFRNVALAYPLSQAMLDGFVKEPAVATRENFDARNFQPEQLERLKLEDGVRIHEDTKVKLQTYALENGVSLVKPFVLVVAQDTAHAAEIQKLLESNEFFGGQYRGKVITVHSKLRGEEADDTVQLLMNVERTDNPTEIVIHVNMLKEGWDVTNLYTIVPLRAANSKTLVEQSIGRGLRLPYGKRTGVEAVDTLTIVSHDKFQEIVDYANRPDSLIRGGMKVVLVRDERDRAVTVQPRLVTRLTDPPTGSASALPFANEREREVAKVTLDVLGEFERLPRSRDLQKPEVLEEIVARVKAKVTPTQALLPGTPGVVDVAKVVAAAITLRNELSIDIPRITIQPVGDTSRLYVPFQLKLDQRLQPVANDILRHHLHTQKQQRLVSGQGVAPETDPRNYIVRGLMDCPDIDYDANSSLLYELAGQVVQHLQSYLPDEDAVVNVLQYYQQTLVAQVHAQMQQHFEDRTARYEGHVSKGFVTLRPNHHTTPADEAIRDFRQPVDDRQQIPKLLFTGFSRCLYDTVKFSSDPERRFACLLERETELKWLRPSKHDLQLFYDGDTAYVPDFVVEWKDVKLIVEVKAANEMQDPIVLKKKAKAVAWCRFANQHAQAHGGKPWRYVLIPHDQVADNRTLAGLVEAYGHSSDPEQQTAPTELQAPFVQVVSPSARERFRTCVPLVSLEAAAGGFSEIQQQGPDEWVAPSTQRALNSDMFVARVSGRSMEPKVPDGSFCLFTKRVSGSRAGRTLIVAHRELVDPESSSRFTVKVYASEKDASGRNVHVLLKPVNPAFQPIELRVGDEAEVRVVGELLEVLGSNPTRP